MVLADTIRGGDTGWKKYIVTGWAIMECLLFAGLLYGWPSLNFVLKSERIYADLCEYTPNSSLLSYHMSENNSNVYLSNTTTSFNMSGLSTKNVACEPQDSRMALCFTIGTVMFGVGCLIFGLINLRFKTMITRLISIVIFMLGTLTMAFINKERPWLMFIGLPLIAIGGTPVFMTNTQVSNLFRSRSSSVVGFLCGAFDMSSGVILIVKIVYDHGSSIMTMFITITVMHLLLLISTFCFLPKDFIQRPAAKPVLRTNISESEEVETKFMETEIETGPDTPAKLPSVKSCLKQGKFLFHVIWLSLLQLRFFYYLGTLNPYLNRIFNGNEQEVSKWTNNCQYIMMIGFFTSPLSGLFYDCLKSKYAGNHMTDSDAQSQNKYNEVMPAVIPLTLGSCLSVILSVLALVPEEEIVLWISFPVLTCYRSFLYTIAAGFINDRFPSEYFGILFGIMMFVGGFVNIIVYGLSYWSEYYPNAQKHVNIVLLAMVLFSFIHPFYLYRRCSRRCSRSLTAHD